MRGGLDQVTPTREVAGGDASSAKGPRIVTSGAAVTTTSPVGVASIDLVHRQAARTIAAQGPAAAGRTPLATRIDLAQAAADRMAPAIDLAAAPAARAGRRVAPVVRPTVSAVVLVPVGPPIAPAVGPTVALVVVQTGAPVDRGMRAGHRRVPGAAPIATPVAVPTGAPVGPAMRAGRPIAPGAAPIGPAEPAGRRGTIPARSAARLTGREPIAQAAPRTPVRTDAASAVGPLAVTRAPAVVRAARLTISHALPPAPGAVTGPAPTSRTAPALASPVSAVAARGRGIGEATGPATATAARRAPSVDLAMRPVASVTPSLASPCTPGWRPSPTSRTPRPGST